MKQHSEYHVASLRTTLKLCSAERMHEYYNLQNPIFNPMYSDFM